jgi:hypothetical protein
MRGCCLLAANCPTCVSRPLAFWSLAISCGADGLVRERPPGRPAAKQPKAFGLAFGLLVG